MSDEMTWDENLLEVWRDRERIARTAAARFPDTDDRMRDVGVPQQLIQRRLSDFTEGPLLDARIKFNHVLERHLAEQPRMAGQFGMVLVGPSATGKTSLAAAALRKATLQGFSTKFTTYEKLSKFHTSWIELSSNSQRYDDYAERANAWRKEQWRMNSVYDYIVIDDFARAIVPAFVLDEMHAMIRERTASGCFTFITSNMTLTKLSDHIGDAFGSFLRREFIVVAATEVLELEALRAGE